MLAHGPAGSGLDIYDTIDDYNNNTSNYPAQNPWGDDQYLCGYDSIASLPQLRAALTAEGFDDDSLRKVFGGNCVRLWQTVWT